MPQLNHFIAVTAAWLAAGLCGALAAWLAWSHPLSPTAAMLGCALLAGLTVLWPTRWALWVFPLLPLTGLMQWTGWFAIEELDLLLLSVAAAGYLRLALRAPHKGSSTPVISNAWWLLLLLLLPLLLGLWHALEAAGAQPLFWWQGDREPLNALRLAKSLFEVLLLLPLARAAWLEDQALASARLTTSLVWLLLITGLGVLWDRIAVGGLPAVAGDLGLGVGMSTLFWESQKGGDAIAAVLALTLPFAAAAAFQARNLRQACVPALALVLGLQACTAGVSPLALPAAVLGLGMWGWLLRRQESAPTPGLLAAAVTRQLLVGSRLAIGMLAAALALLGSWLVAEPVATRLAAAEATLSARAAHWHASLDMLESPLDWAFGKGLGRFPAMHASAAQAPEQGGEIRWLAYEEGGVVQLSSGRRSRGEGTTFQLAQHVHRPQGATDGAPSAVLRMTVRSNDSGAGLRARLCTDTCLAGDVKLDANVRPGQWQTVELRLAGRIPSTSGGPGFLQRLPVLAVGVEPANVGLQIDQMSLIDGGGAELLNNGGFETGLAHWYLLGEPGYSPWHLQNAAVHLLFEQGLLGLTAWLAVFGVAVWRLVFGSAKQRSLAPPLAAALLAVALVGSQDSLFDMPRIAFLGTWLLAVALGIADHRQHRRRRGRKPRA